MIHWNDKAIADYVAFTLPPGIHNECLTLDGDEGDPPEFSETLDMAAYAAMKEKDPRLLDALRAKWPDDVERELPNAMRHFEKVA